MKEKEQVKEIFGKYSESYVTSAVHAKGADLRQMDEWIKPEANMNLLDIATGGGHVAKLLASRFKHVFATDLTERMLANTERHLRKHENIFFVVADAESLPFLDNSFDYVSCRIAAHHFPDPASFIREVVRVLRPGGKFIFIDNVASENDKYDAFINSLEKERDYSHVRSLKASEWTYLLEECGLDIIRQASRKKRLPYKDWVNRTLEDPEKINEITEHLQHAEKDIKNYFNIIIENDSVQSFELDEWMVLCAKDGMK